MLILLLSLALGSPKDVKPGMTRDEVYSVAGEPQKVVQGPMGGTLEVHGDYVVAFWGNGTVASVRSREEFIKQNTRR